MTNWLISEEIDFVKPDANKSKKTPYLLMLPGDKQAHTWEVTCKSGGVDTDLTGFEAHGYFLRADGTVVTVNGTVSGNVVSVTFGPSCYAVPGGMRGAIRINKQNQIVTIIEGPFIVPSPIDSDTAINDGTPIPSLAELLAQLKTIEQLTDTALLAIGLNGLFTCYVDGETLVINSVPLTDDDSYTTAVEMGYTGTEEEWEAFLALVTENSAAITQAQESAEEALEAVEDSQSRGETVTVAVADWTGDAAPYTATVSCTIVTATNNILVGVGGDITTGQQAAITAAEIVCTGQGAGTITLKAFGSKPEIAVPINVIALEA